MGETFRNCKISQPWDVLVSSLHQRHRLKNINHYFEEDNATLGKVCGNNENLVNCERESSCAIVVLQVFAHRKVRGNWRCNWCSSFRIIFSHLWTGMPNSWRWPAGPTPLSNESHQYDRKQSKFLSLNLYDVKGGTQVEYGYKINFRPEHQQLSRIEGASRQNDLIWFDTRDHSLIILMDSFWFVIIMIRLFFMQIPPCPLALYRLCLFSEVSHQKHSCSCCRSESRKSIFLNGQLWRQTIDKLFSLQYEF